MELLPDPDRSQIRWRVQVVVHPSHTGIESLNLSPRRSDLKNNSRDEHPQQQETLREKLSRMGFKEETSPRGEYGMILFEHCIIHLIEDWATPEEGLTKYEGQQHGSFFLTRSQSQELISKLRKIC